jgi:hypothetical protein
MSNLFTPGATVPVTLNLEDGNAAQFPRARVYSNGTLITTIDLGHIAEGRYSGTWSTPATPALTYDVLFIVYANAIRTIESVIYTREMEKWQPDSLIASAIGLPGLLGSIADSVWDELLAGHAVVGSAGEFLGRLTGARALAIDDTNTRVVLLEKIFRNRLELSDGSATNWVLYDDDSVTPLLSWDVADKGGGVIVQQLGVPSRRTRGV